MELAKLYCVPIIIQYLLPIDIQNGQRVAEPILKCSQSEEKYLIDCLYIWQKITEELGLSTSFYDTVLKELEIRKKPILKVKNKHLN